MLWIKDYKNQYQFSITNCECKTIWSNVSFFLWILNVSLLCRTLQNCVNLSLGEMSTPKNRKKGMPVLLWYYYSSFGRCPSTSMHVFSMSKKWPNWVDCGRVISNALCFPTDLTFCIILLGWLPENRPSGHVFVFSKRLGCTELKFSKLL